jgi:hypothetical protein
MVKEDHKTGNTNPRQRTVEVVPDESFQEIIGERISFQKKKKKKLTN